MGLIDEIIKNKEDLVLKVLDVLSGKEAKARLNLDGVEFDVGNRLKVRLNGDVEMSLVAVSTKKKK